MNYKRFPGAVPRIYVKALVGSRGGQQFATLHTGGAAPDVMDFFGVPSNEFAVPDALAQGMAIADKQGTPFFVQIDEGAVWDNAWGDLID